MEASIIPGTMRLQKLALLWTSKMKNEEKLIQRVQKLMERSLTIKD